MGLDSILEEKDDEKKSNKSIKYYLSKVYQSMKNFYKTNVSIKFKFLYASAAMIADRVLTFIGIEYQGGGEANPIMSNLFNYIGIIPASILSYLSVTLFSYGISSKFHKKIQLSKKETLGAIYLGIGGTESLVSLHNYFGESNYNNFIANMSYTQALIPLTLIISAPFIYYFLKNKIHNKNYNK